MSHEKQIDVLALQDLVNNFKRSEYLLEAAELILCAQKQTPDLDRVDYLLSTHNKILREFVADIYALADLPNPFEVC